MKMTYKVGDKVNGRYMGLGFVGTIKSWRWHSDSPEVIVFIDLESPLDVHPGQVEPYTGLCVQYGEEADPRHCLLGYA